MASDRVRRKREDEQMFNEPGLAEYAVGAYNFLKARKKKAAESKLEKAKEENAKLKAEVEAKKIEEENRKLREELGESQ